MPLSRWGNHANKRQDLNVNTSPGAATPCDNYTSPHCLLRAENPPLPESSAAKSNQVKCKCPLTDPEVQGHSMLRTSAGLKLLTFHLREQRWSQTWSQDWSAGRMQGPSTCRVSNVGTRNEASIITAYNRSHLGAS